jgi:SAM-dependent methyltransferase
MKPDSPSDSWGKRYRLRQRIRARYPNIWSVPLVKRPQALLYGLVDGKHNVLEIGAYRRELAQWFAQHAAWMQYKSLDVDRSYPHDYYDLDEVEEQFDLVVLFEVLEHLSVSEGERLLSDVRCVTSAEGHIVISTPNPHHAHRYFLDLTHKSFYSYEELGAALLIAGYRVEGLYRAYNAPFFQRGFRITLGVLLHRYLGIDFAPSLIAVGSSFTRD